MAKVVTVMFEDLKETVRIFYDNLNCFDSRFYAKLHFL